ncbi:MAG: hypothetical protein H6706_21520 [Myxococcales bacterium]|nr:hypothetical protein [Myxococcales bacterium]
MRLRWLCLIALAGCGSPRRPPVVPPARLELEALQAAWFVRGERGEGDRLAWLLDRHGFPDRAAVVDAALATPAAARRQAVRAWCHAGGPRPAAGEGRGDEAAWLAASPAEAAAAATAWARAWPDDVCAQVALATSLDASTVAGRSRIAAAWARVRATEPANPHLPAPTRRMAPWSDRYAEAFRLDEATLRAGFAQWSPPVDVRPRFEAGPVYVYVRHVAEAAAGGFAIRTERVGLVGRTAVTRSWAPTLAFSTDAPARRVEVVFLGTAELQVDPGAPEPDGWKGVQSAVLEAVLPGPAPAWRAERPGPARVRWRLRLVPPATLVGSVEAPGPAPRAADLEAVLPGARVQQVERRGRGFRATLTAPRDAALFTDDVARAVAGRDEGEVLVEVAGLRGFHAGPAWSSVRDAEVQARWRLGAGSAPGRLDEAPGEGRDGTDLR